MKLDSLKHFQSIECAVGSETTCEQSILVTDDVQPAVESIIGRQPTRIETCPHARPTHITSIHCNLLQSISTSV
eukprot:m.187220 g.187220  ORF g.187220 m.187220 type:complete len:74 (-) comp32296_c0_seq11:643-864(-)